LTTKAIAQFFPATSGSIVILMDQRLGNDDVYYCHVEDCAVTETAITTG
jgi:hypothetical protein